MLDILIHDAVVLTMTGQGVGALDRGAVGIKDDKIEIAGPNQRIKNKYKAHRYIKAENKVVMPGLVDSHIHTGLAILRGLSQDINNWMEAGIWPFAREIKIEDKKAGSMLNIIEGVKAGTTTFCDYNADMDTLVENHIKMGTRARIAETINEMPEKIEQNDGNFLYPLDKSVGNRKLEKAIDLVEKWHQEENGRITCLFGPQGPDMLSRELLLEVKRLAEKYDTKIHMHVAQGDREIKQMLARYDQRSIPWLQELNYLDERLMAVHMTEANDQEVKTLANSGASLIICSGSIGIIDGIIPPLSEFLRDGSKAALGSDQAPGNNCNNMFNEMKFTAILNKCKARDPTVLPAAKVLRLATIKAAEAIGLEKQIGSIEAGKKADLIIVDFTKPELSPLINKPIRNVVPNLVYSARGHEVETVMVDGEIIMEERKLKNLDEKKAISRAQTRAQELAERSEDNIEDHSLLTAMKNNKL